MLKYLKQLFFSAKKPQLTYEDTEPCLCGAVRANTEENAIWLGSTLYNDSSYSNYWPEKFFIKCDKCDRSTVNADSKSEAIYYWNERRYRQ